MRIHAFALVMVCACSSKAGTPDAPRTADAPQADAPAADAPTTDASPTDAPSGKKLHIVNDLDWCDVTVNGHKSVATSPADTFWPTGTVVTLHADPTPNGTGGSNFIWGYWTGTDGQQDGGTKDTHQDATITMSADQNLTVCCPFPNGTGC